MRVLVTRPRPDADETAAELRARGHAVVVAPLLTVRMDAAAAFDPEGVQAVLITSANGARALAQATARRDLPLFAVGNASAATARACGFARTVSADGDVGALAALVSAQLSPDAGKLVHIAGTVTAGDLSALLGAAGFEVVRLVAYSANAVRQMPEEIEAVIRDGLLDAALFYSPRTAAQFADLLHQAGLTAACGDVVAVALSPAVAEKLAPIGFAGVRVADAPDQESLFRALEGVCE